MRTIALDEHFASPEFVAGPGAYLVPYSSIPAALGDLGPGRIDAMDAAGIGVQVLSLPLQTDIRQADWSAIKLADMDLQGRISCDPGNVGSLRLRGKGHKDRLVTLPCGLENSARLIVGGGRAGSGARQSSQIGFDQARFPWPSTTVTRT